VSGGLRWPVAAHERAPGSTAETSDLTLIRVRPPIFVIAIRFCLINSYNLVRPSPVALHASTTVQEIRSQMGCELSSRVSIAFARCEGNHHETGNGVRRAT
jgi:hypothetical protein